ncbi:uncharacterized protein [Misgurnus anguillicaudatus]|uniref:uncharacterized protein n=1 Tax=Misgurnus anguillicaudatus TaxID=75329 RepID=UPI003CCF6A93
MEASLSSLPSLPDGSTAPVAPPQPQPSSSSQQTSADDVEDMKVETSLPSTLSPPHSPAPPPTFPPPRRRALKRPAPSSQDEMEPAAKRAKLQRMSPPLVETPSSSQRNKADAEEVPCSPVSQHPSPHGLLAEVTPPPAQLSPPPTFPPPRRRALKRPAPSSQDEREPAAKRAKLQRMPSSSQQNKADAGEVDCSSFSQLSPPQSQACPPASRPHRRRLWRPAPSSQYEMEPTPKRPKLNRMSALVTPPRVQTPSSSQQNKADTAVADCSSVSQPSTNNSRPIRQVSPPASPRKRPAPKRPASLKDDPDEMEPTPKRPRLCNTDIKAQHSSPHRLLTDVTPPQAQLSPPHRQAPPPASPPQRRAVKRPASSQDDPDEMEPTPKRERLNGLSTEVTPPPAQTPSSSQQNKADAGEVECSSVSQLSPPQRHMPPPASCRRLWRPAPSSQDEMEPTPKRAKLNRLSAGVTPPPAQTPSSAQVDLTKDLNVICDNFIENFISFIKSLIVLFTAK